MNWENICDLTRQVVTKHCKATIWFSDNCWNWHVSGFNRLLNVSGCSETEEAAKNSVEILLNNTMVD